MSPVVVMVMAAMDCTPDTAAVTFDYQSMYTSFQVGYFLVEVNNFDMTEFFF